MSDHPENFAARNCPPEEREEFLRENAAACIAQRDEKIARQAKRITQVETSLHSVRAENAKLRGIIDGLAERVAAQSELLGKKAERGDTIPEGG